MLDLKKVPRNQETLLYQSKKPILDGHKDQILDFLPTFEDMEKREVLSAIPGVYLKDSRVLREVFNENKCCKLFYSILRNVSKVHTIQLRIAW